MNVSKLTVNTKRMKKTTEKRSEKKGKYIFKYNSETEVESGYNTNLEAE